MHRYTRLQTVWSLPGHSRQADKGHNPLCHRRPNGPGRLADKVVHGPTYHTVCRGVYMRGVTSEYADCLVAPRTHIKSREFAESRP